MTQTKDSTTGERERIARLLCRQHYGDRGYSLPAIARVVEEELPHWLEKADEVFAILSGPSRMAASSEGEKAIAHAKFALDQWGEWDGKDVMRQTRALATGLRGLLAMLAARPDAGREVEPCFECGSTERIGTACTPCNPELATGNGYDLDSFADLHAKPVPTDLPMPPVYSPVPAHGSGSTTSTPPVAVPVSEEMAERIKALDADLSQEIEKIIEAEVEAYEAQGHYRTYMALSGTTSASEKITDHVISRMLALTAALAVPDKGVQGDQGDMASRDPQNDQCGEQPEADAGATAALAINDEMVERFALGLEAKRYGTAQIIEILETLTLASLSEVK